MKTTAVIALCAALVSTCLAQQTLTEYDWKTLASAGQLRGGVPVILDGKSVLKLSNTNEKALRIELMSITNPPVTRMLYAIVGEVKYESVHGDAYLEMWNYFPPLKPGMGEGHYFSKTLGDSGEMGKITGTSDWRAFALPFDRTGASGPPSRLEINLILPGSGTVFLGGIKLIENKGNRRFEMPAAKGAWWSDRTAGLIGGIGGTTLGCLAGLLAWLASKGKSRRFVVATSGILIGLGVLTTLAGLVAVCIQQPHAVWFTLLLLGVLLLAILPARLKQFQKQYEALELRRMASLDALGG